MSGRCKQEVVDKETKEKYLCGAKSRTYYPFGRKSKGYTVFEKEHEKGCKYGK